MDVRNATPPILDDQGAGEGLTPMVVWEWWSSRGICYNARHESFAQFQA